MRWVNETVIILLHYELYNTCFSENFNNYIPFVQTSFFSKDKPGLKCECMPDCVHQTYIPELTIAEQTVSSKEWVGLIIVEIITIIVKSQSLLNVINSVSEIPLRPYSLIYTSNRVRAYCTGRTWSSDGSTCWVRAFFYKYNLLIILLKTTLQYILRHKISRKLRNRIVLPR